MSIEEFLAMIPLLILFVLSLIFYRKGLLHLVTVAYSVILAFIAISQSWSMLFFPICAGIGIIGLILFAVMMFKGELL